MFEYLFYLTFHTFHLLLIKYNSVKIKTDIHNDINIYLKPYLIPVHIH